MPFGALLRDLLPIFSFFCRTHTGETLGLIQMEEEEEEGMG
jgi:hypothetical protein